MSENIADPEVTEISTPNKALRLVKKFAVPVAVTAAVVTALIVIEKKFNVSEEIVETVTDAVEN